MIKIILSLGIFVCLSACGQTNVQNATSDNNKKSDCDNPDAPISCSFEMMPPNTTHTMKISHSGSGTPMVIKGKVFKKDGFLFPGVAIYAYHTDETGIYSKSGKETGAHKWHGKHHGWAITNAKGEYEIHSIRPAKYPNSNAPAHIHAAIKTPQNDLYWISDFVFKDDPAITERYTSSNPGGTGVVDIKLENNSWIGVRDIRLNE